MNVALILVSCCFTLPSHQSSPDPKWVAPFALGNLGTTWIIAELKLNNKEIKAVAKIRRELQMTREALAARQKTAYKSLSKSQLKVQLAKDESKRTQLTEAYAAKLYKSLTPSQRTRVNQIYVRLLGYRVFTSQSTRNSLKLTTTQVAQFRSWNRKRIAQVTALTNRPDIKTQDDFRLAKERIEADWMNRAIKLLSKKQQQHLKRWQGKPLRFYKN